MDATMLSPGRDASGTNLSKKAGPTGATFTGDLSQVGAPGGAGSEQIFAPDKADILSEERRLIEKVFSIVDKDSSGTIDSKELEEMFMLFGVETHFLNAAIERVMANVQDKGGEGGGMISPEEFYKLLSAKFSKGDSEKEMEDVFDRMGAKPGLKTAKVQTQEPEKELGIEEFFKVAQMLGESSMSKPEIKDMIKCFKRLAKQSLDPVGTEEDKKKRTKPPKLRPSEHYTAEDEKDPSNILNLKEFIAIMNLEL